MVYNIGGTPMDVIKITFDDINSKWKKCKEDLKANISSLQYETYIESLTLVDVTGDTAHFTVPYDFCINTLETKLYNDIKDVLVKNTEHHFTLAFHVEGEYKPANINNISSVAEKGKVISVENEFKSNLNPKYTFDSFIIGNSNRMAYAAAVAISDSPGNAYNPLFIYGNSGLGKTHLMHAIGNQILKNDPTKKVLYVTSEVFTTEFIDAIANKKNNEFRNKYRKIDVLLIDDIQFISRMERTQEEFFYTFCSLYEDKKQIVISCDSPLNKIEILEDRLRTRFGWGLIVDIQVPDFETKVAILNRKASENSIDVDNEILDYIANYTSDNIRELEGVINHLSMSLMQGKEITLNLAKEALKHYQKSDIHEIDASIIIDSVSRYFNMSVEDILSKKRTKELVFPRQISMFLCRDLTNMSYPDIGKAFNNRDHTTVMYACEQISKQINTNPELKHIMEELKRNIIV